MENENKNSATKVNANKKVSKTKKETNTNKNKNTKVNNNKKMTVKEKRQLFIILCVIVIAIAAVVAFFMIKKVSNKDKVRENTKMENNLEVNVSNKVIGDKKVDELLIKNMQVQREADITYIYADVYNNSDKEQGDYNIYISMLDKDGKEIIGFGNSIPLIKPGESTKINIGSTDDFVNAYECKITKIEQENKE